MEEKVVDRRVRKTKRQLRLALMKLMAEKSVKDISVRELAAIADINRGTFYIHYRDVGDLLQRLEDEMAERLILVCRKHAHSSGEGSAYPYLADLYRFARDNADLCLVLLGPNRPIGAWVQAHFGLRLVMTWWSAIFATTVVIFPLMYRTVRGAFEAFDETLAYSGQTLGLSNTYIFWRIRMPCCRQGVLAGTVLAFARALGEYGATSMIAGYTPGKTATISTTVYQLWQTNNDALAYRWVAVNIVISAIVLLTVNMLERRDFLVSGGKRRGTA